MTTRKIERELPIALTDEEKKAAGMRCSELELQLREVENEQKAANAALNQKKKDLRKLIKTAAEEATSGKRVAMVQCEEVTNWPANVQVVRLDRKPGDPDYIVEERPCDVNEETKGGGSAPAEEKDTRTLELPFDKGGSGDGKAAEAPAAATSSAAPSAAPNEPQERTSGDGNAEEKPAPAADEKPAAEAAPGTEKPSAAPRKRHLAAVT